MKKHVLTMFFSMFVFAGSSFGFMRYHHPNSEVVNAAAEVTRPAPRGLSLEYLDVAVLFMALVIASWLVLRKRSRRSIFLLMLFSLLYFGFWRKGCVCSVGSIQNISLSLFDGSRAMPWIVSAFFALPLIFSIFFGRVFCAAVCPLGAAQDVVVIKPLKLPAWLTHVLGILPHIYLGFAVLLAMLGADFIICRFDPFVGFFRLGASSGMFIVGACFLIVGTVVARPYCRFLCPYGVLLNWTSRFSKYHMTITPNECINCKLCENSCPFDAINTPSPEKISESRRTGARRLAVLVAVLPILVVTGFLIGSYMHVPISRMHSTVSVAERVMQENAGVFQDTTDASDAFRESKKSEVKLFEVASVIRGRFKIGSGLLGGFLGLVVGLKLLRLSVRSKRDDYTPDKGTCLSCGRCFAYCPVDNDMQDKRKGHAVVKVK